jgi:hypothetical protein
MASQLLDFYRREGTDSRGRRLEDIWTWGDDRLERVHNYIQWLFPLPEPSRFNAEAPLLREDDIAAFRDDPLLQANLRKSLARILTFLGLTWDENEQVVEGPNLAFRSGDVWAYPNHNWLRITRILRSLRLLGLEKESEALYGRLEAFYRRGTFSISADTFQYWTEAVKGLPFHSS